MNFSIYGDSDRKHLDNIASSVYSLGSNEYKVIPVEGDESKYFLYINTDKIVDSSIKVHLSKDLMSVSISMYPGINVNKSIGFSQIKDFLKEFGILEEFINNDRISEAADAFAHNLIVSEFKVGEGIVPENGSKCVVERLFESPNAASPAKLPGGAVNYKTRSSFVLVDKNDLLLRRKPPTQGVNGKNIRGEAVYAIPGEDKVVEVGEGVEKNDNNTEFRAKYNGHLVMAGNMVSVLPVLEIKGDVDLRVGNVTFDGTVHVSGNVLPGFNVNADNVLIDGIVENAGINARTSVTIKTGRKGAGKSLIKAGGDIVLGYCENGEIFSGGEVEIQKYCFNSEVSAEKIYTSSKDGIISGGTLRAFSEIRAASFGSQSTNDMAIYVGVSPTMEEKAKKVMMEINNINASLQKISDIVKKIDLVTTDALKDPKFRKLLDTVTLFKRRLPLLQKKYEELMSQSVCENPKLVVENTIRSGIKIIIGKAQMVLKNDMSRVEFFFDKETCEIGFKNL